MHRAAIDHGRVLYQMTAGRPLHPSPVTGAVHRHIRERIPTLSGDRPLAPDIELLTGMVHSGELLRIG